MEEIHRVRSESAPGAGVPGTMESGAPPSRYHNMFTKQADSLSFGVQFFLGFHDTDEIIDHVIKLHL